MPWPVKLVAATFGVVAEASNNAANAFRTPVIDRAVETPRRSAIWLTVCSPACAMWSGRESCAPADPLHVLGGQTGRRCQRAARGFELAGDLRVGVLRGKAAGDLDRFRWCADDLSAGLRSLDGVLLSGA